MEGNKEKAGTYYENLIRSDVKDDVTNLALTELDGVEGSTLTEDQKVSRGKLAYNVWNFDLTRKYIGPYALKSIENAYYYARALSFLGDSEGARKTYQAAIGLWPEDPRTRLCIYQYANLCLRLGDNARAAELYNRIRPKATGEILENTSFNLVQAFRAQSKLNEAVQIISPYCAARRKSTLERALFLRARIYFQGARYREALTDIKTLLVMKSFH